MVEQEHQIKVIPVDMGMTAEIEKLIADGWKIVPDVTPIAIYHLVRIKKQPTAVGVGELLIDETKIHVVRNGQIVG